MKKIDPRIVRTRKLIMDAFVELCMKKDYKDITIKDITSAATVNRATFYYHFVDKYDLLEKVLQESIMTEIILEVTQHEQINEQTLEAIFLSLVKFQLSISQQCKRSYDAFTPTIEKTLKVELEHVIVALMQKRWPSSEEMELRVGAIMLSWGLYGAAMDWMQHQHITPEQYIQKAMPFIQKGMMTTY